MFVYVYECVCVLTFLSVKDFSGTTVPRILKFGTNYLTKLQVSN